jgi:hypothetical protein
MTYNVAGLSDKLTSLASGYSVDSSQIDTPRFSPFVKMIVMDVIFDPNHDSTDELKKNYWQSAGVINMDWVDVLPRNTIIAKLVGEQSNPIFVFPFFPSHLAFPCKPGEAVWAMFEEPDVNLNASSLRAYWFCRITEPHHVDDVNHTHAARVFEPELFSNAEKRFKGEENPIHELRNGPVLEVNGIRSTSYEKNVLVGESEDIFEQLISKSDASKIISYESIPRYRKRPGDIALEGSNNTLIVLGTDRSTPGTGVAQYVSSKTDEEIATRTNVASYPTSDFKNSAGSIDLVVGRGQTSLTSGIRASTTSINNASERIEIKKELDKTIDKLDLFEGDSDFSNDRSRILLSQRTKVDEKFGLTVHNSENFKVSDSETGDSAVVIKSDKVRIIARSDLQFLVTNFSEANSPDDIAIKRDSNAEYEWASVTIKSNGDIIFKPGWKGYIKLGAEDADKAILCTDKPAIKNEGTVSYSPGLITTGASVVGTGQSGQGTFATRVLVK